MIEILLISLGAMGFGFFMIFLLALSDKKRKETSAAMDEKPALSQHQFEKACMEIIEAMKLEIDEINRAGENQVDVLAHNPTPFTGGQFLIHCKYIAENAFIESTDILELSNEIIQDRVSKGMFMTTGRFAADIETLSELAPIEKIDGQQFKKLMDQYKIVFTPD